MKKEHPFLRLPLLILSICVLLLCAVSPAFASTGAVDLVIVLDDSGSMYGSKNGNDPNAYRFDAASIMLNMCGLEGSRASVFVFGNNTRQLMAKGTSIEIRNFSEKVFQQKLEAKSPEKLGDLYWASPLVPIDLNATNRFRELMTERLSSRELIGQANSIIMDTFNTKEIPGKGTNLGAAMHWAIETLDMGAADRGDRTPMILVLADGACDDPDILEKAINDCAKPEKGYKVYTILLHNEKETIDTSDENIQKFMSMSTRTGAPQTFMPSNATELPNIFTEIFADQIGSEVTPMELTSEYDEATGKYTISIPVPNRSVSEANIMMPTGNGSITNIQLYQPNNTLATEDRSTLFCFDTYYFKQYKLIKPTSSDKLGMWKLVYKKQDGAQDDVSVNIVFSYNIDLSGEIVTKPTTNGTDYYKGDKVDLRAIFVDDTGTPSKDDLLYRGISTNDVEAIRCYVKLVPKDAVQADIDRAPSIELDPDKANLCFYKDAVSADDFDIQKAGEYEFIFFAEGDGLIRESGRVPYTIENQAPAGNVPEKPVLRIQDPNAEDLNKQDSKEIDFTGFVSDPDGDAMTITATCADKSLVDVVNEDTQDSVITVKSLGKAGSTTIDVTFNDHDQNGTTVFTLNVDVLSVKDELANSYEPHITILEPASKEDGTFENGSTLRFALTIDPKAEAQSNTFAISDYTPQLTFCWVGGDSTGRDQEIPLEKDPIKPLYWTGEFTLPNNKDSTNFDFRADLNVGKDVLLNCTTVNVKTDNQAPLANQASIERDATVDPFMLFGKQLGADSTDPWVVSYSDLFYDPDVNDELSYTFTVIDGDTNATVTETEDGKGILISPMVKGQTTIRLTAEDPSKQSASCDYLVTMISNNDVVVAQIKRIGTIVAIALVALIILYNIFRPRFNGLNLKIHIKDVAQKSVALRSASKTKAKLSFFTTTEQKAENLHRIISGVVIKPCWFQRSRRVKVCWKNTAANKVPVALKVGAKAVKDKKGKNTLVLRLNDSISLIVKDQKHSWKLEKVVVPTPGRRNAPARPAATRRSSTANPYNR